MSDTIEQFPPHPAPPVTWPGAGPLKGGKGYARSFTGQVHYRALGPATALPAVMLFHQCPQSLIEFAEAQNELALRGVRSVAVDLPGYGMSDHPDVLPTVGGFADNMIPVLDALGLRHVVAAGHHTGAAIATALAARHPDRVSGVILHGLPLYSEEEAAVLRHKVLWDCTPRTDGSHVSQLFKWVRTGRDDELKNLTWMSVGMLLQGGDIGHWAVNRYAMEPDLLAIRSPGMIISEVEDMTHDFDQRARRLRPDFKFCQVDTPGNAMIIGQPGHWAEVVSAFVEGLADSG